MTQELILFLSELKENNNKEWFSQHRLRYEKQKEAFLKFIELLITEISKYDKSIANIDAKKTIFRINRDIRFSKDKSPYKTNFGAYINAGGKKSAKAGYYIHIEPNNVFIAGGLWQPQPNILAKIRQEIDYNSAEFLRIIEDKNVRESYGDLDLSDTLKNVPKGYSNTEKISKYFKLKSFILFKKINQEELFVKDTVINMSKFYKAIYPLNCFINKVFDDESK